MALIIANTCVNCWVCVDVCPSYAIYRGPVHLEIDPEKCGKCLDDYTSPQCASVCPIEEAIIDAEGNPLNPKGSLRGIASKRLAAIENKYRQDDWSRLLRQEKTDPANPPVIQKIPEVN